MKLYGFGPTRSLRALWGLKELGAEFEFEVVNLLAGEISGRNSCVSIRRASFRCWSTAIW